MSSVGAVRTACRNRSQTSGIGCAPAGRPVLAATTRLKRSGCSATSRSSINPTPVLPDEGDAGEVEGLERKRLDPGDMASACMVGQVRGLVEAAEADEIRGDRPQAGGARIGMTLRYRNDQVGSPCRSSTGARDGRSWGPRSAGGGIQTGGCTTIGRRRIVGCCSAHMAGR
jgi:hypothetical protein